MNIKRLMLSFTLASAVLGTGVAHATCLTYGPVEQIYTSGTTTYIYVSPSNALAVPSYVYYFGTTDHELAEVFANSLHKNVYISGDAATCPTTGTYRYGGVGSYIYAN